MTPRTGQTLYSTVDATTVVVIKAPGAEVVLTCGGVAMADAPQAGGPSAGVDPGQADGTQLGKRYADEAAGLEVLCTKAGQGTLSLDGAVLPIKGAKPLPASD